MVMVAAGTTHSSQGDCRLLVHANYFIDGDAVLFDLGSDQAMAEEQFE